MHWVQTKMRSTTPFLYVIIFLSSLSPSRAVVNLVSKNGEVDFMNFFHKPGLVLIESVVAVLNVSGVESCQFECLSYAPCLSINVGRTANQTRFTCELNNSTSLAKPLKMRKRRGFDFYGPAEPCFSNPCLNGGICISNLADGSYRCNCSLQILPNVSFSNDHCAIDPSVSIHVEGVFHNIFFVRLGSQYSMNYYHAERACMMFGAVLANLSQLTDAWRVGFEMCAYGWLIDASARYPMFYHPVRVGCGGGKPPGIRGRSSAKGKSDKYDAYCFKETDECNEENWYQHGRTCYRFYLEAKVRWNEASSTCTQEGSVLGVFKTKGKLHFVKDFLQRRNSEAVQILVGLQKDSSSGAWTWSDGTTVDFSLWNVTQPSGPIGTVNTHTISLDNVPDTGQWVLPFVCQKRV